MMGMTKRITDRTTAPPLVPGSRNTGREDCCCGCCSFCWDIGREVADDVEDAESWRKVVVGASGAKKFREESTAESERWVMEEGAKARVPGARRAAIRASGAMVHMNFVKILVWIAMLISV